MPASRTKWTLIFSEEIIPQKKANPTNKTRKNNPPNQNEIKQESEIDIFYAVEFFNKEKSLSGKF